MRQGTILRFASQVLLGMVDVSDSNWRAKMCGVCRGVGVCSNVSQNKCHQAGAADTSGYEYRWSGLWVSTDMAKCGCRLV